ncbi:MAG: flagellar protein export ATPase FliI [Pseudomonadales bacterium]|nr:flagellar protein export ATPase FliI [Pseudomonadales bacterium]
MQRQSIAQKLDSYLPHKPLQVKPIVEGKLTRVVGLTLEAVGCVVSLGDRCQVIDLQERSLEAEVVGFDGPKIYLMPLAPVDGLQPGATVIPLVTSSLVPVGNELLGRVINGLGEPIDDRGKLGCQRLASLEGEQINPMRRARIDSSLDVGISSINSLCTVGKGQRIGLFAGSGVGKSVLLCMMTKATDADVIVVGLIGERGREVKEFIDEILGEAGLARSVVVCSPADESPLLRMRAANFAMRVAEDFRQQGKDVLLLMDSLTRYAMAQREIALAIGEPPATKGYPPSVFAKIPQLVERTGNSEVGGGSITAFFTVLTEGDDQQDPIADSARAILDGHVVLSRRLAEEGHYPAVDIEASVSRVMPAIVDPNYLQSSNEFRKVYSCYEQNRDLISVGAYVTGSDPEIDKAIERRPYFSRFLQQALTEQVDLHSAQAGLKKVLAPASPNSTPGGAPAPANRAA